jgi:SH3-like domain-containing protein
MLPYLPYRFRHLGFYGLLGVMGLAALALLPGDETARPAAERIATVEPTRPSYLVEVPQTVDTMQTGSVSATAAVPAEQQMPAPITAEPDPVATATLTVSTPPAGSDEFPMDVIPTESTLEAPVLPAGAERLTVRSAVNMRVGPSTSTSTIMVLRAGEPVAVLDRSGGWVNVALADGQSGWVYERYLSGGGDTEEQTASIDRRRAVDDDDGHRLRRGVALRDRPSIDGAPLFRVEAGEDIEIAERRRGWVRIRVGGGVSGWVPSRYVD